MSWFQRKLSDIPLTASLLFGVGIDRIHKTVPQTASAAGLKNKQLLLPTGRVLGGTAMLNAMIFSFGNREDESSKRFHSWNPHFFSELFKINESDLIHILKHVFKMFVFLISTPLCLTCSMCYIPQAFTSNSKRWSPYVHCLKPILKNERARVTVLPETVVDKVLIDPNSEGKVIGVKADSRGVSLKILLKNPRIPVNDATISPEVILSAGTFETPAILLRSGIGTSGV
ncbi:uncharacterized protein DEA37_0008427, partial [Paragonimus westermani]